MRQLGTMVRRLTPTECERLQGFPDGYTAGFSDSVRYRYGTPPLPCAMAVYLKVGDDDYVAYGLSGGPDFSSQQPVHFP